MLTVVPERTVRSHASQVSHSPSPAQPSQDLAFGHAVLEAHGVQPGERPVVLCQNFIVDGAARQPVVDPVLDAYLGFLGLNLTRPGDIVLSLRTLPGLLEERRRLGIIAPATRVIEVEPELSGNSVGYPHTSPIARLKHDADARSALHVALDGRAPGLAVSTFMGASEREVLEGLGLSTVQRADPSFTNNKVLFGRAAPLYGFTVARQAVVSSPQDFEHAAELLIEGARARAARGEQDKDGMIIGAWMKAPGGSGGDLVKKLAMPVEALHSPQTALASALAVLRAARAELVQDLRKAFQENRYGSFSDFISEGDFAPYPGFLVEQDVRALGKVVANASNYIHVHRSGAHEVLAHYKQLTGPGGDYRGSHPWNPQTELSSTALVQMEREFTAIAGYARQMNLLGPIGVDYFIVQTPQGDMLQINTELNGRLSISGAAEQLARRVGARAWANTNLAAKEHIRSYEDFERQFQDFLFTPGDFSRVSIIPQAFRTLQSSTTIIPSRVFKALIVGPDQETCSRAAVSLSERYGK